MEKKEEDKAKNLQPKTDAPVRDGQESQQDNTGEGMADQPKTGGEQPTPVDAAKKTEPAAKPSTKKTEPKVSDAVRNIGKDLLKSNPDMSVVYMTADGLGFYEKNDADNHARMLNNKAVTPVKR